LLCFEEAFVSDKFRNPNAEQWNPAVASVATRKGNIIDVTSEDDCAHFTFIQARSETSKWNGTFLNSNRGDK
jgi:hypothetical protein